MNFVRLFEIMISNQQNDGFRHIRMKQWLSVPQALSLPSCGLISLPVFWLRFDLDQKTSELIKNLDGHEIPGLVFCEGESFFENENWGSISRNTLAEVEDFTSLNVLNAEVRDIGSICSYKIMVGETKLEKWFKKTMRTYNKSSEVNEKFG